MMVFPLMNAIAKHLSAHLHVGQVLFMRQAFYLICLFPIAWWRYGAGALRPAQPVAQVFRGIFVLLGGGLFFFAIARMPIADALAVYFIFPFVITLLSPFVLGERVGIWRWSAVVTGFLGALVIIQPGGAGIGAGTLFALAGGTSYAIALLLTRRLAVSDPPLVTATISGLVGLLVAALPMPWVWQTPRPGDWLFFLALGAIALIGQSLVILAHTKATAAELAPYAYSEIAMAVLVGLVLFGDFPDPHVWLGIAVIVSSGIVIAWREGVKRRVPG
jgi:drug/metabolite transporter (DMT)-like permease